MKRLTELESLRGLLALWVLLGHVVGRTFADSELAQVHLSLLNQPILSVYIFIILSGFVIMYLLDQEGITYRGFILRRYFRLAPLYVLVIVLSALTLSLQLLSIEKLPWRTSDIVNDIDIHKESLAHFWQHVVAHLLMVQSLLPNSVLRYSDYTLVGQSWSISLEWQFYIIAPLLFRLIASKRWLLLSLVATLSIVVNRAHFAGVGFIGNQFGYFLVGILSYFAYKHSDSIVIKQAGSTDLALCVIASALYFFLRVPWPLIIWTAVLLTVIAGKASIRGVSTSSLERVLNLRPLAWLGRVSYSIYLIHILVLNAVTGFVLYEAPTIGKPTFLAITLPLTVSATLLVSALAFRFVESPGMRMGKLLSYLSSQQVVA